MMIAAPPPSRRTPSLFTRQVTLSGPNRPGSLTGVIVPLTPGTIAPMTWAFIWMVVVLKIPIAALLWLCWWAIRSEPEPEPAEGKGGGDGGAGHSPRPHRPRPPRRGAHAQPAKPPARIRAV